MEPICPLCATPLQPEPPAGAPHLSVDGEGLGAEPGREVGFQALYCPLNHAVHLRLDWRQAPVLLSPDDYLSELTRRARELGLNIPDDD
jgi:hypothetical protein